MYLWSRSAQSVQLIDNASPQQRKIKDKAGFLLDISVFVFCKENDSWQKSGSYHMPWFYFATARKSFSTFPNVLQLLRYSVTPGIEGVFSALFKIHREVQFCKHLLSISYVPGTELDATVTMFFVFCKIIL